MKTKPGKKQEIILLHSWNKERLEVVQVEVVVVDRVFRAVRRAIDPATNTPVGELIVGDEVAPVDLRGTGWFYDRKICVEDAADKEEEKAKTLREAIKIMRIDLSASNRRIKILGRVRSYLSGKK